MKKMKKALAVLSAAVMTVSICAATISSEVSARAFKDKYTVNYTYSSGVKAPININQNAYYDGILVTMPNDNPPTAEQLDISCSITKCEEVHYGYVDRNDSTLIGFPASFEPISWHMVKNDDECKNQYLIETYRELSEIEADELAKKLVAEGVVENATLYYTLDWSTKYINSSDSDSNEICIKFREETDVENFSFEKYPEIKEMLKFTNYDKFYKDDRLLTIEAKNESSKYCEAKDYVALVEDIKALEEKMTAKYEEVKGVGLLYYSKPIYTHMDNIVFVDPESTDNNIIYSNVVLFGDVTNNGEIDLLDAVAIAKYLLHPETFNEEQQKYADYDGNGKVDIIDAVAIAKYLLEKNKK